MRTHRGEPTTSESIFLRGMDDDTLPGGGKRDVWVSNGDGLSIEDKDQFSGFEPETRLLSGGQVVSATTSEP
ncbi:hypothetical protein [Actinokineospora pegani]|uniref:hypothetical protein n=1 Tax=Actinokineospora pegani TaxID=2654637 RepID=UPI0012E9D0C7|nr:hypothetical protein [Actinokineospora pegani]